MKYVHFIFQISCHFFQLEIHRSSHLRCFVRKGVLRNFAKFTGKHLCQSLFFKKVAGLKPATLLKKRLGHMNFAKVLRTPFLQNTSGRLLLDTAVSKQLKLHRSSHPRCSVKKSVLKNFENVCKGPQACNFIKKRLQHMCFLVKFATFLRTPTLKNICEQLLLAAD